MQLTSRDIHVSLGQTLLGLRHGATRARRSRSARRMTRPTMLTGSRCEWFGRRLAHRCQVGAGKPNVTLAPASWVRIPESVVQSPWRGAENLVLPLGRSATKQSIANCRLLQLPLHGESRGPGASPHTKTHGILRKPCPTDVQEPCSGLGANSSKA